MSRLLNLIQNGGNTLNLNCNFSSPTEEGETPKPKKMAIPPEVEARLGPAITVEGMDAEQIKATLKTLYERYLPRKFSNS